MQSPIQILLYAFAVAGVVALPAEAIAAPPRAVSLDYCADQYVLALAEPEQVLALSRGADKDYAYLNEEARAYRRIRATPEEALALKPDLVIRQWGGGANAGAAYGRFGATVISLGFAEDFDGVVENIRTVAAALDAREKGESLITELKARLDALAALPPAARSVLYVTPGGVTAGAHTMIDAIIRAAGAVNAAAAAGKSYWPPLPAEDLLLDPPNFIATGFFSGDDEAINYWSAARHPALRHLIEETPSLDFPPALVSCAAFHSIVAAEELAKAVRQ